MTQTYTLVVGPHRFAVVSNPATTKRLIRDSRYGETDIDSLTISIRGDLPATLWDDTLYHELLHASIGITGLNHRLPDQLEEDLVATIAPLLTQAIRHDTISRKAVE